MSDITVKGPAYGLAAARVLIVEADAIEKVTLYYPRVSAFDPQITTIAFEGQDTSQTIDDLTRVDLALTLDKRDLGSIQRIFAKTRVSAPASGEAEGLYMGDPAEVAGVTCGLELDIRFRDESVALATLKTERLTFLNGSVKVVRPQQMEYGNKWTTVLNFSFLRTTEDILGDAIANIPEGGAVYRDSILS